MKKLFRKKTLSFCTSETLYEKIHNSAQADGVNASRYLHELVSGHYNERSTIGDIDALRTIIDRLIGIEGRTKEQLELSISHIEEECRKIAETRSDIGTLIDNVEALSGQISNLIKSSGVNALLPENSRDATRPIENGRLFK